MQNLKLLLETLLKHEVDFVLVGGFAGVVHGTTLVTQDLDICAAITDENVARLRSALAGTHAKHRMNPGFKPAFESHPEDVAGLKNIYLETDLGILDVMSEQPPVGDFARIKSHALQIELFGHRCKVIAIDDLIRIKETMNRPKDRQAVEELKAIKARLS